jgi:hypothetical protein
MNELTDYQLIENLKKNYQNNLIILYERYKPMIGKYFKDLFIPYKYKRSLKKDFFQDCYIELIDSYNSVNIEKINCRKEDWIFGSWFKFKLMSIQKKYWRDYCKNYNQNESILNEIEDIRISQSKTENNVYLSQAVLSIKNLINDRELKILYLKLKGKKLIEIKNELNLSYSLVHRGLYLCERAFKKIGYQITLINHKEGAIGWGKTVYD